MVIVAKQETYAKGNQEVFRAEFERNGGQVVETIEYPEGGGDFSSSWCRKQNIPGRASIPWRS